MQPLCSGQVAMQGLKLIIPVDLAVPPFDLWKVSPTVWVDQDS